MSAPDVAGIWTALAKAPGKTPEQRRRYRRQAATIRASNAMSQGRRWHTRGLLGRRGHGGWKHQPRDARGRWCRP